jgi:hypothetical protein
MSSRERGTNECRRGGARRLLCTGIGEDLAAALRSSGEELHSVAVVFPAVRNRE